MHHPIVHVWTALKGSEGLLNCYDEHPTTLVLTPPVSPGGEEVRAMWYGEQSTSKCVRMCGRFLTHTAPRVSVPQPAVESSSLPFGQSRSPSHSQCRGTQAWEPWQLNMSAAQVMAPETQRKDAWRSLRVCWKESTIDIPYRKKGGRQMLLTRKRLKLLGIIKE